MNSLPPFVSTQTTGGLRLILLGPLQLHQLNQQPVDIRLERVQALLAYLVLEARHKPVRRSDLAEILWPGYAEKSARTNLRSALYNLRQILLPYDPIDADRVQIRLRADAGFSCDLWAVDDAANQPSTASPIQPPQEVMKGFHLDDAPAFMDWLGRQRRRYAERLAQIAAESELSLLLSRGSPIPDHRHLVGRETQLAQLRTWLVEQPGRLVGIFGMGGQGKTTLAATFARGLDQGDFDLILWSTLVNAQPWTALFSEWVHALTQAPPMQLPDHLEGQLALLLGLARQRRVLFVLDNLETILEAGEVAGHFLPGYAAYGQFLERMAQSAQGSAVLLTSREQPVGFARWLQSYRGVHRLGLHGLDEAAGEQLLRQYISVPAEKLSSLTRHFSGNPLALLLAARTVSELFADDISAFLALDTLVFGDVREVLTNQFERLTRMEQQVLYQLALAREPLAWPELRQNLPDTGSPVALLESIHSLSQRSLIDSQYSDAPALADGHSAQRHFGLQNVVMEFVTDRLVERMAAEIEAGDLQWMGRLALTRADTVQYIREMQARLILQPILQRLLAGKGKEGWVRQAHALLDGLRGESPRRVGYAAVNLLHLLLLSDTAIRGRDFSRLPLPNASLAGVHLPAVDLTGADLSGATFTQQLGGLQSLTVHPDGHRIVAGDWNGMLWLWQIPEQSVTLIPTQQQNLIRSAQFSPNGKWLAYVTRYKGTSLWDVEQEKPHGEIPKLDSITLAFSPDSRILAGTVHDEIWLWEVAAQRLLPSLMANGHNVLDLAFTPDGRWLISTDSSGFVYVWDWPQARLHHGWQVAETDVRHLAVHPQGTHIAGHILNRGIKLWTLAGEEIANGLPNTGYFNGLAFSPDGEWLAGAGHQGLVHLWQAQTGQLVRLLRGHTHFVEGVAFFAQAQWLVSASSDRTIRVWDVESGRQLYELSGYRRSIAALALAPDGRRLICGGHGAVVNLWDTPALTPQGTWAGHQRRISGLAFHPDGQRVASASADTSVRLWDVGSGLLLRTLWGHERPVQRAIFHPQRPLLVSASSDGILCVWQVESGALLGKVQAHNAWISDLIATGDGTHFISAGGDTRICLWSIDEDAHLLLQKEFAVPVRKDYGPVLALLPGSRRLPDGGQLAFGTMAGVYLCDLESGKMRLAFPTQPAWTMALAASPDGYWLVSAHDTKQICLWEVASGQMLWQQEIEYTSEALRFSPDGRRIYTGNAEGYVEVWDAANGERLDKQRIPGPYEGMNIGGVTGISKAQYIGLLALGAVERRGDDKGKG
ncbi:MAG: hypothetical protein KJZ86_05305 [Caldilineaceae bacterium]|nr:hypothetical protein [Caldilineaceae bacterium]